MKKNIMITILVSLLTGCISPSATLSSASGKKLECSSSGFGLIFGEMAKSEFNKCVTEAQMKGYKIDTVKS